MTTLTDLVCSVCGDVFDASQPHRLCPVCQRPLLARYDLPRAARTLTLAAARSRPAGFAAYAEVMPFGAPPIDLGEGRTPLVRAPRLDDALACAAGAGARAGAGSAPRVEVYVKDESVNPTGSFKARGLCAAISRARELGITRVALPTAGNAGLALAAYAAAGGMEALVVCPSDTPAPFVAGARQLGAEVVLHDGLIDACGRIVAERAAREGFFDCSTLKEPYRAEGKKTMGYDLVRDLGRVPDVVVYPAGGGTGIVGMWKAFAEMEALGWIDARRPRMVAVQAEGCAPLVRAFHAGAEEAAPWENAATIASGLRVPRAVGDRLILAALRASGGTALAVDDAAMIEACARLGAATGVLAAPEGGACLAAAEKLATGGFLRDGESVVLFNTGTALSYVAG